MKKIWILTVLTIAALSLFTACASEADTMISPSPSASTAPAPTMPPAVTNDPAGTDAPLGSAPGTNNGMAGNGGMAGADGTTGNASAAGVTTMEDSRRVSQRVAEEVEKLSELDGAEAIVVDDMAVVGVKYDSQYKTGMDERLKKMVEARVQAVDKNITKVYVVESVGDMDLLTKLRQKLTDANYTLEELRNELMELTGRVMG